MNREDSYWINTIEEQNLHLLQGRNSFINDLLAQARQENLLSDKQLSALKEEKEKVAEEFGSIEQFRELRNMEEALHQVIVLLEEADIIESFWSGENKDEGHIKAVRDMKTQLQQGRTPSLSSKQRQYLFDILDNYSETKIKPFFHDNPDMLPDNETVRQYCTYEEGSWSVLRRTYDVTWNAWKDFEPVVGGFDSRERAVKEAEQRLESTYMKKVQFVAVPTKDWYVDAWNSNGMKTLLQETSIPEMEKAVINNELADALEEAV